MKKKEIKLEKRVEELELKVKILEGYVEIMRKAQIPSTTIVYQPPSVATCRWCGQPMPCMQIHVIC